MDSPVPPSPLPMPPVSPLAPPASPLAPPASPLAPPASPLAPPASPLAPPASLFPPAPRKALPPAPPLPAWARPLSVVEVFNKAYRLRVHVKYIFNEQYNFRVLDETAKKIYLSSWFPWLIEKPGLSAGELLSWANVPGSGAPWRHEFW